MIISAIVAVSQNGIIGADGKIPWKLPEDMKRFKQMTMGHHLIMGRKTYESIGRPLPGRTTIGLSRMLLAGDPYMKWTTDLHEALNYSKKAGESEVFICGGASVYKEALPLCDRLYLTLIERDFEGDTRFDYPSSALVTLWQQTFCEPGVSQEGLKYSFNTYNRRK